MTAGNEHILFLTGKLAHSSLTRVLDQTEGLTFTWQVHEIGVSVAALMTADMIARRLTDTRGANRIIVPGRCRGDLNKLSEHFGLPVQRGPDELKDLPRFFGHAARQIDLSQHDMQIFAEIVDAPELTTDQIVQRAGLLRSQGADVIDLGCLPQTPFVHLAEAVRTLKTAGYRVSVDSMETEELKAGAMAGADYLFSLNEHTLALLKEVPATPILVPATPGDLPSLQRAIDAVRAMGRDFLADPILDPIHFGFTESLLRYYQLRRDEPDIAILMGTGNVTELTHADTAGITMTLLGIMSELRLNAILTTQVSQHARRAVSEADHARRVLYAARGEGALPKNISDELMMLHERDPFPDSADEVAALAALVKDPNYRIQVSRDGLHLYNRDGLHSAQDPYELWPHLEGELDASHAFYLGAELSRAQIAWQLGKRYVQDEPLDWGVALDRSAQDMSAYQPVGITKTSTKGRK